MEGGGTIERQAGHVGWGEMWKCGSEGTEKGFDCPLCKQGRHHRGSNRKSIHTTPSNNAHTHLVSTILVLVALAAVPLLLLLVHRGIGRGVGCDRSPMPPGRCGVARIRP